MTSQPTVTALAATTDRRLIRADGRSRRFVLAEITAPAAERRRERLPVNLAFILDRSGSMSGEKIALAKQTITTALGYLGERDRFSVSPTTTSSTWSSRARRRRPRPAGTRLSGSARSTPAAAPTSRRAGSAAPSRSRRTWRRRASIAVLLLTDGLANKGMTDPKSCRARRRAARAGHLDHDLRDGRRLRRGPAPVDGRRGRRPLLLRARRRHDPRPPHERGRRDARGRRPRRRARDPGRRGCLHRGDLAAGSTHRRGSRTVVQLGDLGQRSRSSTSSSG